MPKSGEKKEDKMDEMVGWPDHIITYYIVGKLRLPMGGEIIYEEAFLMSFMHVQLNKYDTAPNFIQLNHVDFTCFYQFLHYVIIKLFCTSRQNNFYCHTIQEMVKKGKFG